MSEPIREEMTDEIVATAQCPEGKRSIVVWDTVVIGFGLRIMESGSKTFMIQSRDADGRDFSKRLGHPFDKVHPINVAQARAKAIEILKPIHAARLGEVLPEQDKNSLVSMSKAFKHLASYLIQMQPHANDAETSTVFSTNAELARELSILFDLAQELSLGNEPKLDQLLSKFAQSKSALKPTIDPTKPAWQMQRAIVDNLTGSKFGRLLVLRRAPNKPGDANVRWLCRCDCGNEKAVVGYNLKKENGTRSCGCLKDNSWESLAERAPLSVRMSTEDARLLRQKRREEPSG